MLKSDSLIHGKEGEDKAKAAAYALFTGEGDDSNMTTTEIPEEGMVVDDILVRYKLAKSRGEARRPVEQGGITIDGNKINDVYCMTDCTNLKKVLRLKRKESVP